eukprot:821710-Prymnesium_polylepis.1
MTGISCTVDEFSCSDAIGPAQDSSQQHTSSTTALKYMMPGPRIVIQLGQLCFSLFCFNTQWRAVPQNAGVQTAECAPILLSRYSNVGCRVLTQHNFCIVSTVEHEERCLSCSSNAHVHARTLVRSF